MTAEGQDVFAGSRARWMEIAEQTTPELKVTEVYPITAVEAVKDETAFQGWRFVPTEGLEMLADTDFKIIKSITLDFGSHVTGHLVFRVKTLDEVMDAPVRLKFVFGEVPAELNEPFDPWRGTLSRAWMQDEILTVDVSDCDVRLPRRVAFRYLRIELLGGN